ncbi:type III secretion flagellar biosynthesis inner membrane protein [Chlamydia felis Fe/C-56]|uniref:Type III secretion flagellar biosynthesis inner membrane protein n=1 Tax=Chlamydia felis (strain Fe/C-56) TaxID=264202 RepID=Q256E1_CHLFF|nr:type III secretion system export apparatus subunit SctS [Chlamydia felis]BAE80847.1 type III secretion flagellar biosynthesis inner membrane protein [Chlamydia felis Fe/C-56]
MIALAASFKSVLFEYSYQSLLLILIISAPPIILASIVGIVVAIFQAATQIQEQTFAFAIKLVVIFGTLIISGGWLSNMIFRFASQIFQNFYKWK